MLKRLGINWFLTFFVLILCHNNLTNMVMDKDYYKKCKICEKEYVESVDFHRHLKGHSIKVEDYMLGYVLDNVNPTCLCGCESPTKFDMRKGDINRGYFRDYVNGHYGKFVQFKEVKKRKLPEMKLSYEPFECKVCGTMLRSARAYKIHVQKEHNIDMESYVIQHLCDGVVPTCKCGCGTRTSYEFAENLRFNNYHREVVIGHHWNSKEFRNRIPEIIEKTKKTNIEKYGVDNVFKSDLIKNKSKKTKLDKYGDANYTNVDKQVQTKKDLCGIVTKDEYDNIKLG